MNTFQVIVTELWVYMCYDIRALRGKEMDLWI